MEQVIEIIKGLNVVDFLIKEAFYFVIASAMITAAILIDLSTGIKKAKALKCKIYSKGLRMTFTKLGDYLSIFYFGVIVDIAIHMVSKTYVPVGIALACLASCTIECISVIENLKARKSAAGKVPEIAEKIVNAKNVKEAVDIINTIKELTKEEEQK
jgi:hypothetical protein